MGDPDHTLYVWAFAGAFLVLAIVKSLFGGPHPEREAIERNLERRGCRLLRLELLPYRQGLLVRPEIGISFGPSVEANVYQVTYRNRADETLVAVCQMGQDLSVHWTAEHREPGFDRFGNPQNLSLHGSEWRG